MLKVDSTVCGGLFDGPWRGALELLPEGCQTGVISVQWLPYWNCVGVVCDLLDDRYYPQIWRAESYSAALTVFAEIAGRFSIESKFASLLARSRGVPYEEAARLDWETPEEPFILTGAVPWHAA